MTITFGIMKQAPSSMERMFFMGMQWNSVIPAFHGAQCRFLSEEGSACRYALVKREALMCASGNLGIAPCCWHTYAETSTAN